MTVKERPRGEVTLPSGIVLPDLRDEIERARRYPDHCLYCTSPADSREHCLPEALGGRLAATVLCAFHNAEIGRRADEGLIEELRSCAHLLGVKRQRKRGSVMYGLTDDGERLMFMPDGKVKRKRLDVLKRAQNGKVVFAKGDLLALEDLRKSGALEKPDDPVIATLEKPPPVTITMTIGPAVERGVLKIALHFVASFLTEVELGVATDLLPYVYGKREAGGEYVRALPLSGKFFPTSWPPKHIVAAYVGKGECYVTVLLFGLYGFNVRLPLVIPNALRYVQRLDVGTAHPDLEPNDHTRGFGWDDRLTPDDFDALKANMQHRHDYFMNLSLLRTLHVQCRRAAIRAANLHLHGGSVASCYRAGLQMEGFSSEQITLLMHASAQAVARGGNLWDIPYDVIFG